MYRKHFPRWNTDYGVLQFFLRTTIASPCICWTIGSRFDPNISATRKLVRGDERYDFPPTRPSNDVSVVGVAILQPTDDLSDANNLGRGRRLRSHVATADSNPGSRATIARPQRRFSFLPRPCDNAEFWETRKSDRAISIACAHRPRLLSRQEQRLDSDLVEPTKFLRVSYRTTGAPAPKTRRRQAVEDCTIYRPRLEESDVTRHESPMFATLATNSDGHARPPRSRMAVPGRIGRLSLSPSPGHDGAIGGAASPSGKSDQIRPCRHCQWREAGSLRRFTVNCVTIPSLPLFFVIP